MTTDNLREDARALLGRLLEDAPSHPNREMLIEVYVDEMMKLYGEHAHQLLTDVINDAHTRLDARLSPDPIRQTIATVQTTVQDIWKNIWGP